MHVNEKCLSMNLRKVQRVEVLKAAVADSAAAGESHTPKSLKAWKWYRCQQPEYQLIEVLASSLKDPGLHQLEACISAKLCSALCCMTRAPDQQHAEPSTRPFPRQQAYAIW